MRRTALLALAMAFLAVAWVWDGLIAVGRAGRSASFPGRGSSGRFVALIDWLPAPLVLLDFPRAVPDRRAAPGAWRPSRSRWAMSLSGAIAWIVLKMLAHRRPSGDLRSDPAQADDHALVRLGLREGAWPSITTPTASSRPTSTRGRAVCGNGAGARRRWRRRDAGHRAARRAVCVPPARRQWPAAGATNAKTRRDACPAFPMRLSLAPCPAGRHAPRLKCGPAALPHPQAGARRRLDRAGAGLRVHWAWSRSMRSRRPVSTLMVARLDRRQGATSGPMCR